MSEMAKFLIMTGVVMTVVGIVLAVIGKIPGVGKLPGDVLIKKENFTFYFPLATCLALSLLLTLIFNLFRK